MNRNKNFIIKFYDNISKDPNIKRLLFITVSIFIILTVLKPNLFLSTTNFSSMAYQFPEFGLLTIAISLIMITGGIDLSAVGIANLSGISAAYVMTKLIPKGASSSTIALYIFIAILVSTLIGVVCGAFNGFLIAKVGIVPILATLGTMSLYTGIAVVFTKGSAIYGFPDKFILIGNNTILGIPIPLLIFIIAAIIISAILNKTSFGIRLYLLGTNPKAAKFAGIDNENILFKAYILCGLLSSVAGIIMIARTNSAKADYGSSYVMQAILAGILGGVNPYGGHGKVMGLILSILSLQFLSSGLNIMRVSSFCKDFTWGSLLLIAMAVDYMSNQRRIKLKIDYNKKITKL